MDHERIFRITSSSRGSIWKTRKSLSVLSSILLDNVQVGDNQTIVIEQQEVGRGAGFTVSNNGAGFRFSSPATPLDRTGCEHRRLGRELINDGQMPAGRLPSSLSLHDNSDLGSGPQSLFSGDMQTRAWGLEILPDLTHFEVATAMQQSPERHVRDI